MNEQQQAARDKILSAIPATATSDQREEVIAAIDPKLTKLTPRQLEFFARRSEFHSLSDALGCLLAAEKVN
jgi:hypothetical protein